MDELAKFTPWIPWNERQLLDGANDNGVYLLAHFLHGAPTGPASSLDPNIVYIGETHGQTLLVRWRQFARSAETGRTGHAGGRTYHGLFGQIQPELHVACYSPKHVAGRCRSFFIRFIEAKLVWNFSRKHEPDQLCNRD